MNDYNSFDQMPITPGVRCESDSLVSVKEEESCDTKKLSDSESSKSEGTK